MAVATRDNLEFQFWRKRLGLRQPDVRRLFAERMGKTVHVSAISEFENGIRDGLTDGATREDYEQLLREYEEQLS